MNIRFVVRRQIKTLSRNALLRNFLLDLTQMFRTAQRRVQQDGLVEILLVDDVLTFLWIETQTRTKPETPENFVVQKGSLTLRRLTSQHRTPGERRQQLKLRHHQILS